MPLSFFAYIFASIVTDKIVTNFTSDSKGG